jgi:hypothetical protein
MDTERIIRLLATEMIELEHQIDSAEVYGVESWDVLRDMRLLFDGLKMAHARAKKLDRTYKFRHGE